MDLPKPEATIDIQDAILLGEKNENGLIIKWTSFTREGGKILEARKFRGLFNHW